MQCVTTKAAVAMCHY